MLVKVCPRKVNGDASVGRNTRLQFKMRADHSPCPRPGTAVINSQGPATGVHHLAPSVIRLRYMCHCEFVSVRVRRGVAPGPGVRRTGPDEELALGSLRSRGTTVSPFNESKDGGPGMTNEPQIEAFRRRSLQNMFEGQI